MFLFSLFLVLGKGSDPQACAVPHKLPLALAPSPFPVAATDLTPSCTSTVPQIPLMLNMDSGVQSLGRTAKVVTGLHRHLGDSCVPES